MVRRSKVSQIPDVAAVPPITLRQLFSHQAAIKALKALRRHGEKSVQFQLALRSRWLNQNLTQGC
jgi:hypothetical protein